MLYHVPDRERAYAEIRRVLRPGGRLLLTLVTPLAPVGRLAEATSRIVGQPFRWPTAGALRRQVEAAGLRVERQRLLLRMPGALLFPPSLTVARRS
jgi:SAM-dependent methyltransferase